MKHGPGSAGVGEPENLDCYQAPRCLQCCWSSAHTLRIPEPGQRFSAWAAHRNPCGSLEAADAWPRPRNMYSVGVGVRNFPYMIPECHRGGAPAVDAPGFPFTLLPHPTPQPPKPGPPTPSLREGVQPALGRLSVEHTAFPPVCS